MAKGSFATGTMSGKLGIYVFMRRKGEQVSRAWVKPKNAQTRAQGVQRSSLSNIIRMYQASSGFFKSAFENKPVNQSDYNAFVSRNLKRSPQIYLPKIMSDNGGSVVAPYVISDGSLQPIAISGVGIAARTNISLGSGFVIDANTTVGQISEAILSNNTFLLQGDQLSYLSYEQYTYEGYPRLRSRKYEFMIDPLSGVLLSSVMPTQAVAVVSGFLGHGPLVYSGAFAWVYSRLSNSGLKVSRQSLIVTSNDLYAPYVGEEAATRAADTYGNNQDVFLNPSTNVSFAEQPSVGASIASVYIDGDALSSSKTAIKLLNAGSIPATTFEITGSGLSDLNNVSVSVTGSATESGSESTVVETVGLNTDSDTSVYNIADIAVTGITWIKGVVIRAGGAILFSWRASGGTEDPGA